MTPAVSVVVGHGGRELAHEVAKVHEEHTVFSVQAVAKLFQKLWGPATIGVAPGALVLLASVGVPDLEELIASRSHVGAQKSEGVALHEARSAGGLVRAGG